MEQNIKFIKCEYVALGEYNGDFYISSPSTGNLFRSKYPDMFDHLHKELFPEVRLPTTITLTIDVGVMAEQYELVAV